MSPPPIRPPPVKIFKTQQQLIQEAAARLYRGKFEGLNKRTSDDIKAMIYRFGVFDEGTEQLVINAIIKEFGIARGQASNIVRTESHEIVQTKREIRYAYAKVKWISIPDKRRTPICERISQRTQKGVSVEELKQIIKEEADRKTYKDYKPFTPHIGCRSVMAPHF